MQYIYSRVHTTLVSADMQPRITSSSPSCNSLSFLPFCMASPRQLCGEHVGQQCGMPLESLFGVMDDGRLPIDHGWARLACLRMPLLSPGSVASGSVPDNHPDLFTSPDCIQRVKVRFPPFIVLTQGWKRVCLRCIILSSSLRLFPSYTRHHVPSP